MKVFVFSFENGEKEDFTEEDIKKAISFRMRISEFLLTGILNKGFKGLDNMEDGELLDMIKVYLLSPINQSLLCSIFSGDLMYFTRIMGSPVIDIEIREE